MQIRTSILLASVLVVAATAATAGDGRIEINQARAEIGFITPGDDPGLPILISEPGSYVLTGPLVSTVQQMHAIEIATVEPGVTIDLNGFTIQGSVTCTGEGASISCDNTVSHPVNYSGIMGPITQGADGSARNVIIRNGAVRGFASNGIICSECIVENVYVTHNANAGVWCTHDCIVVDSILSHNGAAGLGAGNGSFLSGNQVHGNGAFGVSATAGPGGSAVALIHKTTARVNGHTGIRVGDGGIVSASTAESNASIGFWSTGEGSLVVDSAARLNGTLQMSVASNTTGYATSVFLSDSTSGTVSGGTKMDKNLCDGSAVCP